MMTLTAMATAVFALCGGLAATAVASASAVPAQHTSVVAFNWWHGNHERNAYYGSVRPVTLGGRYGEPVTSLHWRTWNRQAAQGTGRTAIKAPAPRASRRLKSEPFKRMVTSLSTDRLGEQPGRRLQTEKPSQAGRNRWQRSEYMSSSA